jgi:hypothetical protein
MPMNIGVGVRGGSTKRKERVVSRCNHLASRINDGAKKTPPATGGGRFEF